MAAAMQLTPEEITRVYVRVAEAVSQTADDSPLPAAEQDRLLTEACQDACQLLVSWLASANWAQARPKPSAQVVVIGREDYLTFLDDGLTDMLTRAGMPGYAAQSLVNDARVAVERIAGRHLPSTQRELHRVAEDRLKDLRRDVCTLRTAMSEHAKSAAAGKNDDKTSALRRLARAALKQIKALLPALVVTTIVTVTPGQVSAAVSAWSHDAAQMVATCLVVEQAQPHVVIEPPRPSGPGLSL